MSSQKTRGKNFVDDEVIYLLELVAQNKKIIENKRTDGPTNVQKAATWKLIEDQFNRMFPFNARTADKLITKYDNVKQLAKKYAAKRRQAELGPGGRPCMLEVNVIYDKLLEIINKKQVDGEECEYDCDNTERNLLQSSCFPPKYEQNNEDVPLLLVDVTPTIVKVEMADPMGTGPTGTETDEIPHTAPPEQKISTEEEDEPFVASIPANVNTCNTIVKRRRKRFWPTNQNQTNRYFETEDKYYNLKLKCLEADIALKTQELKEKKEQEHYKLELLKLQVEEQQLLVLEKKRKLGLE